MTDARVVAHLGVAATRYARGVSHTLARTFDGALVGVYLYGSGAIGDFVPGRSDIDLLAVVDGPLGAEERRGVVEAVAEAGLPYPAKGLDLYVVSLDSAARHEPSPRFEVRMLTDRGVSYEDEGGAGEDRLILHYVCLRDHGRALCGHHPEKVFGARPRAAYVRQLRLEIERSREFSSQYQVLNACRDWRFVDEHRICSKAEGVAWAARRSPADAELLASALALRQTGEGPPVDEDQAADFVDRVAQILDRALAAH